LYFWGPLFFFPFCFWVCRGIFCFLLVSFLGLFPPCFLRFKPVSFPESVSFSGSDFLPLFVSFFPMIFLHNLWFFPAPPMAFFSLDFSFVPFVLRILFSPFFSPFPRASNPFFFFFTLPPPSSPFALFFRGVPTL